MSTSPISSLTPTGFKILQRLKGHRDAITRISWSPNGNKLASGATDNEIYVWLPESGDFLRKLRGHSSSVHSVVWVDDERMLVSVGADMSLRLWDTETGALISSDYEQDIQFVDIVSSNKYGQLILGASDGSIQMRELSVSSPGVIKVDKTPRVLPGHFGRTRCLAMSPDGETFASGAEDGTVRLWSCADGELRSVLRLFSDALLSIAWSSDSEMLAVGCQDKTIRVWDANSGRQIRVLEGHTGGVSSVGFSSDNRLLVSKALDGTIRVWRCDRWEAAAILESTVAERNLFGSIKWHPAEDILVSVGDQDRTLFVWDVDIDQLLGLAPTVPVCHYINAKVVLLGESGVGKSGLAIRLVEGKWRAPEDSTHGARAWQIEIPEAMHPTGDLAGNEVEITLFDLAGQPEYRLTHQLFIDDMDVALLLFDCRREDPFQGIPYWLRVLKRQAPPHAKKYLVASRVDVSPVTLSNSEIDRYIQDQKLDGFFRTSAKAGFGVDDLMRKVLREIPWNRLYRTTTPLLFENIRELLLARKRSEQNSLVLLDDILGDVTVSYTERQEVKTELANISQKISQLLASHVKNEADSDVLEQFESAFSWQELHHPNTPRLSRQVRRLIEDYKKADEKQRSYDYVAQMLSTAYFASSGSRPSSDYLVVLPDGLVQATLGILSGVLQSDDIFAILMRRAEDTLIRMRLREKDRRRYASAIREVVRAFAKEDYIPPQLDKFKPEVERAYRGEATDYTNTKRHIESNEMEFVVGQVHASLNTPIRFHERLRFLLSRALEQIPGDESSGFDRTQMAEVIKQYVNDYIERDRIAIASNSIGKGIQQRLSGRGAWSETERAASEVARALQRVLENRSGPLENARNEVIGVIKSDVVDRSQQHIISHVQDAAVEYLEEYAANDRRSIDAEAVQSEIVRRLELASITMFSTKMCAALSTSSTEMLAKAEDDMVEQVFAEIPTKDLGCLDVHRLRGLAGELVERYKIRDIEQTSVDHIKSQLQPTYVTRAEVETVVGLLQARGLVYGLAPTPNVKWILLRPELLNQYASAIIRAARNDEDEMGSVRERDVLVGNISFAGIDRRLSPSEELTVLESTVELLIQHDLCFREMGRLVFPYQINQSRPEAAERFPAPETTFRFSGSVETIYASLVVRLWLSDAFELSERWRDAVVFQSNGCRLGFVVRGTDEGTGEIEIFFDPDVKEEDKRTFIGFITRHLGTKGIEIEERFRVWCLDCGREIENADAIEARVKIGRRDIICQYCDSRVPIPRSIEEKYTSSHFRSSENLQEKVVRTREEKIQEFKQDQVHFRSRSDDNVNILHLSDMHIVNASQASIYWTQLYADLRQELKIAALDYLVISGDVAHHADLEEYRHAIGLVDNLVTRFNLDPNRVVIVPGNHDLDWDLSASAYNYVPGFRLAGKQLQPRDIPTADGGALIRDETLYQKRFNTYSDAFYRKVYNGRIYPENYDDQAVIHLGKDDNILFLGLNSSWDLGHHLREPASIRMASLSKALTEMQGEYGDWLKIAVFHHPVAGYEAMSNEFLQLLHVSGFQICMHGHVHEATHESNFYDNQRKIHLVGAGTFGAPTKTDMPNVPMQYNLLRYDKAAKRITVFTRKKAKSDGAWSADARWGDKNDPKPYYTIELR